MTPKRLLEHAENVQLEILKDEMISMLQESIKDIFDKTESVTYGSEIIWNDTEKI